jgi:diadenosine tetraphosphate (Ap4A) HIT family hydrolase
MCIITITSMAVVAAAGVIKMNPTYQKFCTPDNLIKDYDHWALALRPVQATLGACVIVARCAPDVTSVGALSPEAGAEFLRVIADFERALRGIFNASKFNYTALMLLDPQPHFHAIPRYENPPIFQDTPYPDAAWPKIVDLLNGHGLTPAQRGALRDTLRAAL